MYGHKWSSTYGETDAGNIWLACLSDITPDQLMIGLRECANSGSEWPPSAPEFKAMCLARKTNGLPTTEEAYQLCCKQYRSPSKKNWPHPAVYHAGKLTGWFLLGTESEKVSLPKFRRVYQDICKRVEQGEAFLIPKDNTNLLESHDNGKRVNTEENKRAGNSALQSLKGSFN